jgi:hypothetical protein
VDSDEINLSTTSNLRLINKALGYLQPRPDDVIVTHAEGAYHLLGRIDSETFSRASGGQTFSPRYLTTYEIWKAPPVRDFAFLDLPNFDDEDDINELRLEYALQSEHILWDQGYSLRVLLFRPTRL